MAKKLENEVVEVKKTTSKKTTTKTTTAKKAATKTTTAKTKKVAEVKEVKEVVETSKPSVIKINKAVFEQTVYEHVADETEETKVVFNAEKEEKKQKVLQIIGRIVIYFFLILFAVIVLFPFYFMIISSLKTSEEFNASIPTLWIQYSAPQFQNYITCLTFNSKYNFMNLMLNTVLVGVISTVLSLVLTILAAYAFARLQFKGRDAMFALLLGTMMIPGELFTITNFATIHTLRWTNTFEALIVPFLVSVFYIYLLRQNFKQIPDQLYYAAKVDGTSDFKYLWKVMIPLAAPSIVSITILKLMGSWNSYLWPDLVNDKESMQLISNGLRNAFEPEVDGGKIPYHLQMAACVLVSIPLFLVFIFFRKYIMKGVSKSGIKG